MQEDLEIYQKLMLKYFPCTTEKDIQEKTEDKRVDSKSKPDDSKSKPDDSKSKPNDPKSKPNDPKSKLCDPKSKLCDSKSKLCDSKSKLCDSKSKLCDSKSKPNDSKSNPSDSKPKPVGSTPMTDDEKLRMAEETKERRSQGRGRGRGKKVPTTEGATHKIPLFKIAQSATAGKTEAKKTADDKSHTEESKRKADDSKSFSREGNDSKEKMDTSGSDVGVATKVSTAADESPPKSVGDDDSDTEKSKEGAGDLGSFSRKDRAVKMDTLESGADDTPATAADKSLSKSTSDDSHIERSKQGAGDSGSFSSKGDEESMDISENDKERKDKAAEASTVGDSGSKSTADENSGTAGGKRKTRDSGSFSGEGEGEGEGEGDSVVEEMDTSESDAGNAAKSAKATTHITADEKGEELNLTMKRL